MHDAASGDLRIAYQVFGDGPLDLVIVPGFVSNVDLMADSPSFGPMFERLGRMARYVIFDQRGTRTLAPRELVSGACRPMSVDVRRGHPRTGNRQGACSDSRSLEPRVTG
jgi:hypothetical protein